MATFINYLSVIWKIAGTSTLRFVSSPWNSMLWRWHCSLNFMNQPLGSKFSSEASSPLRVFKERVSTLVWIRLGLGQCCSWLDLRSTSLKLLSISNKVVSLSYHSHVHWSSTFNFPQELFLCTHTLASCHKRLSFQPILAYDMPSSLTWIKYSFWFKVRDVQLFLSLEHLEDVVGLLIGLISILLCLRE